MFQTVRAGLLALALAADPGASAPRLLKATSGPRGSVQGAHFVVDDPRAVFTAGTDRQVVVSFEWEAPPGKHHCEASWRDPSGRVVLVSPADYDTRAAHFGAYWILGLPEAPPLGLWAVEATVDGTSAGTHVFQIVAGAGSVNAGQERTLGPKDLYARAMAATAAIEAAGAHGEHLWTASGFYVDDQHLVTAFQVVEGASSLRAILPGGRRLDASAINVANRRQDWAVLRTESSGVTPLTRAPKDSVGVGDHGVFLDQAPDGSRTLEGVSVVGRRQVPGAGPRLNLSSDAGPGAIGSPLLNDHGDVVGIMGGALVPGASLSGISWAHGSSVSIGQSPMAVPIGVLPDAGSFKAETFQVGDLLARGIAARPVTGDQSVAYGILGQGEVTLRSGLSAKSKWSRRDGTATLQITWDSAKKREGQVVFQVFDIDNKMVEASKPGKIKVRAGELEISSWKLPVADLNAGVYRIDVLLGDEVVWRTFLNLTD